MRTRYKHLSSKPSVLFGLVGFGSMSSGSVFEFSGPAETAAPGDGNNFGGLSPPDLGYHPRFGRFGEMSMKEPALKRGASKMLRPRQNVEADCNPGEHSCLGLGQVGCCENTHYCFVNANGLGLCCPLGTHCNDDPCPIASYFCTTTAPTTVGTASIGTTMTGCCRRACLLNYHSCALTFGGGCCGNNSACIVGNKCLSTPGPAATPSSSGTCPTSSFACSDVGCCPDGFECMQSSSVLGCTNSRYTTTPGITGDSLSTVTSAIVPANATKLSSGGLSTGAKAAIGVAAAVVVLALIGLGIFFIVKLRSSKKAQAAPVTAVAAAAAYSQQQPPPPLPVPPVYILPQSPFVPQMQERQFFSPNVMAQQYHPYPAATDQGYYIPQSPSQKPSPNTRPMSEVEGSGVLSSYIPPQQPQP